MMKLMQCQLDDDLNMTEMKLTKLKTKLISS